MECAAVKHMVPSDTDSKLTCSRQKALVLSGIHGSARGTARRQFVENNDRRTITQTGVKTHPVNAANGQVFTASIDCEGEEAQRHIDDDGVRVAGGEGGLEAT